MAGLLSAEALKAHNATGTKAEPKADVLVTPSMAGFRERKGTMDKFFGGSETASTSTAKNKLFKLRNKLKLYGSFSKSGSESQVVKRYENTYMLEPKEHFVVKKAEDIILATLEHYLKGKTYDARKFPNLSRSLAELIKERVKETGCSRYKLVSHVLITENAGQTIKHTSRCLWNKDFDNYATATYESKTFTAVGTIWAAYFD